MGGDKGKGKGSTSGSSSKTKHKKQKGADQPNPPSQDPGGDPWPEDVGDPFYPDQPRSVPDFNEQDVAGGSSTGNYTHQPSPPNLNISLADVNNEPWAAMTMRDASATCPVIGRRAVADMGHTSQSLTQPYTVPTSIGDIYVYAAIEIEWNEFNDRKELLRYGTSFFYVTDEDLSPYDLFVPPRFGKKNKNN